MSDSNEEMPITRTGPDCGNDPATCRLTSVSRVQEPLIEWTPEFDGLGQMTNYDPNTFITIMSCSTCGGEWEDSMTRMNPTRTETKRPRRIDR